MKPFGVHVAWLFLLGCHACSQGKEPNVQVEPFVRVSIETGGFCGALITKPCWVRTVILSDPGTIAQERFEQPGEPKRLTDAEMRLVRDVVDRPDLRALVVSKTRNCPEVFDFDAIVEIQTSREELRDIRAAGCLLSPSSENAPYRRLFDVVEGLRLQFFGEIPAPPRIAACLSRNDAGVEDCVDLSEAECAAAAGTWMRYDYCGSLPPDAGAVDSAP